MKEYLSPLLQLLFLITKITKNKLVKKLLKILLKHNLIPNMHLHILSGKDQNTQSNSQHFSNFALKTQVVSSIMVFTVKN